MTGSTRDPVAQLMETGNLVVRDANDMSGHFLWQSFDYPCDTLLPGMKLGKNFLTGQERHLSSWKSSDDPAPGKFAYRCDPQGYPQNILSSGSAEVGRPSLKSNSIYAFELVYTKEEITVIRINCVVRMVTVSLETIRTKCNGEMEIGLMGVFGGHRWIVLMEMDLSSIQAIKCRTHGTPGLTGT
ncbi:hypothetical protein CsSME_00018440 [Camellia sinensis var. sinensis]